ncbi:hypothetical protein NQZ68_011392 [Dissostichus eleginoides]|nr:hypothetical protein NQZ68_011392 [Dissostichus eleginoides]
MFCATGGICLVNQSEQAAGPFVIGWGAGRGLLLAERTYEHQQHPAPFSGEYRMHSFVVVLGELSQPPHTPTK